ncbi:MAG TPA: hypothetical protein VM689_01675 [Aliidongia sp.]|nr:hypothetical protein [Aliidongia sp.]
MLIGGQVFDGALKLYRFLNRRTAPLNKERSPIANKSSKHMHAKETQPACAPKRKNTLTEFASTIRRIMRSLYT